MEAAFLEFSPGSSLSLIADRDWRRVSNGRLICLPKPRSQTARVRNVLFCEGDPANEVFEIVKGAVAVMRSLSGGRRQILDVVGPGHMVGFTARPVHECAAVALTATRVIAFDRHDVHNRHWDGADCNAAVLAEVDRLRRLASLLGRKTAIERLATFLADLLVDGDESQVVMPLLSRQEIADHLGLALETVSRGFLALKQRGVIARAGRTSVKVFDCAALRKIAAGDGETIG